MSATPARCSRCSAWAPRCGRSTRCSSPTTPATATGPGRSTPAMRCASWWTASPRATCCGTATPCCPATWATPAIGEAILHAVARVREANPNAIYCCDPVIGDVEEGVYVREGIEEFLRDHALPQADIATPNRFELERLTGLDLRHAGGGEAGGRAPGCDDASGRDALRAADQPGDRAHAGRSPRPAGGGGGTLPPAAHAAPAGIGERRRRRDRRAVPVPSPAAPGTRWRRWRRRDRRCTACCAARPKPVRARS